MVLRIAFIGQSSFGAAVLKALNEIEGVEIAGVFTLPDGKRGEDLVAKAARELGDKVPLFKIKHWRKKLGPGKFETLKSVKEKYKSVKADLNVLAFVTQFIPMDINDGAPKGAIVYHPSLLPKHRGASAINWTLMEGDEKAGFTVFFADQGLDTGPILLQKETNVGLNDSVNSLYKRFLFPEGVKGIVESVKLIRDGKAPRVEQPSEGASYDMQWTDKKLGKIKFEVKSGLELHNFIRGCDSVPGAWVTLRGGHPVVLGGSKYLALQGDGHTRLQGTPLLVDGADNASVVDEGVCFTFEDCQVLCTVVKQGRTKLAPKDLLKGQPSPSLPKAKAAHMGRALLLTGIFAAVAIAWGGKK